MKKVKIKAIIFLLLLLLLVCSINISRNFNINTIFRSIFNAITEPGDGGEPQVGIHAIPVPIADNPFDGIVWKPGEVIYGEIKVHLEPQEEFGNNPSDYINSYVRIIVYKYLKDEDGNKITNDELLDSINLNFININDGAYVEDLECATSERRCFFYMPVVQPFEELPAIVDYISFDKDIDISSICNPTYEDGEYRGNCKSTNKIYWNRSRKRIFN